MAADAIYQSDQGLEVRLKDACDDCALILGEALDDYLSWKMN